LVFLSGSMLYSQITVSGTISDAGGAIPGVNVIVKGTSNGAVSDFDGKYSLDNVAEDATLVFSFVGFKTKEVAVNGQSTVNVTLEEDAAELEQVVVIGYGTTTVKDATGSVAAVTSEDFNSGVIDLTLYVLIIHLCMLLMEFHYLVKVTLQEPMDKMVEVMQVRRVTLLTF